MTWWDELKAELNSRLQPNYSPYAGQQPIGRNIWGEVGAVDTHYPVKKPFSVPSNTAWVDRNGNTASISVDDTDYTLDHNTWNSILNQADKEQLAHIEQRLRDAGFFHVSELPPELRKGVETDAQADKPKYPPMLKYDDIPREDRRTGEAMLLPPHIYHQEPVPDETDSLEYDNGERYLPPYNPNAIPNEGEFTPRDYDGAMPPVGDKIGEKQFDDYLEYAPPVNEGRQETPFLQRTVPEQIPLIPYWFTFDEKQYQPTANAIRRRLKHA